MFNPDKKSKWCTESPDVEVDCQDAVWKLKIIPGFYKIIVTYGDSETAAKYDLIINEKPIAGEFLLENQYATKTLDKFNLLSGELKLTSKCPDEDGDACRFSWSRISALEVIHEEPDKKDPTHAEL